MTRRGWMLCLCLALWASWGWAMTPEFADLHREKVPPSKDVVLKKLLFVTGLMNAAYHGVNDLVAALQLVKNSKDPREIAAQLFAVQVGLEQKPSLFRYIAREIKFCEAYPNFPMGFNDSPEGPEPISKEFYKIAGHIEKMRINFESTDLPTLQKEAERVVFELFWTDSEKVRSLCSDILYFVRDELKEDLPFSMFSKPIPRR